MLTAAIRVSVMSGVRLTHAIKVGWAALAVVFIVELPLMLYIYCPVHKVDIFNSHVNTLSCSFAKFLDIIRKIQQ